MRGRVTPPLNTGGQPGRARPMDFLGGGGDGQNTMCRNIKKGMSAFPCMIEGGNYRLQVDRICKCWK